MIIWSGYGFLVFVIVAADSFIANLISDKITNDSTYYDKHFIPLGLSFLFSALVILYLSKYFQKKMQEGKGTRVFDWVTISRGDKNTLFFIPFRYWSYIMAVIGICIIAGEFMRNR